MEILTASSMCKTNKRSTLEKELRSETSLSEKAIQTDRKLTFRKK